MGAAAHDARRLPDVRAGQHPVRAGSGGRAVLHRTGSAGGRERVHHSPVLVSLYADRRLAVSSTVLGLILVGFGVAAILLAPWWGVVSGRIGPALAAAAGLAGCGVFVALIPWAGSVLTLTATWTVAGGLLALATVGVQSLAATEVPGNRGGAVSVVSAFRFAGGAVAPLIWLPLYPHADSSAVLVFTLAGVVALLGAGAALTLRSA